MRCIIIISGYEEGPSGRVLAQKRWDYFGEDTGILFDVGPGVVNFGAHYFPDRHRVRG